MRHRASVVAETFRRTLEVAADDVDERVEAHLLRGVEGVLVVQGDVARFHVPLVGLGFGVRVHDVLVGLVVLAEHPVVHLGILVADGGVGEEPKRLVVADAPGDALVDVGLDHLSAPVPVVGPHEIRYRNVVEEAGHDGPLRHPDFLGSRGALEHVSCRSESKPVEVDERRLRRHRRKIIVVGVRAHPRLLFVTVQLLDHGRLESFRLLGGGHELDDAGASDSSKERPAIHDQPPLQIPLLRL